jgi:UDP-N-acetylmuramyl pentapeptide phosphotransferase/UDP-N-acetylglucosamine-1-phosphate transferase
VVVVLLMLKIMRLLSLPPLPTVMGMVMVMVLVMVVVVSATFIMVVLVVLVCTTCVCVLPAVSAAFPLSPAPPRRYELYLSRAGTLYHMRYHRIVRSPRQHTMQRGTDLPVNVCVYVSV